MDTTGTFEVYDVLSKFNIVTALNKFYSVEELINETVNREMNPDLFMISTGINDNALDHLIDVFRFIKCNWICIDIANGYISKLVEFAKCVREQFPDKIIVAGNVVTREMVEELLLNGNVDIVKVGIGSGAVCTTRIKTGVGMPQLSAIIECADAAHGIGGHIISDGGITCPGDMAKAFGAGADFVMAGSIFAGHTENPGDIIVENNNKYKIFYGMSSKQAMEKHYGKMDVYRSSEGRCLKIKYKGDLKDTVLDYLGGLRSTCTYINARSIKEMSKCTTFMQVNQQINASLI
jgi:GMP reductase